MLSNITLNETSEERFKLGFANPSGVHESFSGSLNQNPNKNPLVYTRSFVPSFRFLQPPLHSDLHLYAYLGN